MDISQSRDGSEHAAPRWACDVTRDHGKGSPSASGESVILSPHAIRVPGLARNQSEAIEEAGDLLVELEAIDPAYVEAMHEREAEVSTFMGYGVAVPHATSEAKSNIHRTAMSVVKYDEPIAWGDSGEEKVSFVVAIAGIGDEHLMLLQAISQVFAEEDRRRALAEAEAPLEVLAVFDPDFEETRGL